MTTIRILRAFAWMRWRVLLNSFERTGARDVVERFSLAMDQMAPIIALLLLVPSALMLAALGGAAGYSLGDGGAPLLFEIVRYLLLGASLFSLIGPLMLPASGRPSAVRLLLLPIPRATLYVAQAASALTEPWILLAVPPLLALPVGLLVAGLPGAALVALLAGTLLIVVLLGLSAVATTLLQLVFRDRRRGELAALLFILIIPLVGMLPAFLESGPRRVGPDDSPRAERKLQSWAREAASAGRFVPSELFVASVRGAANHDITRAVARSAPLVGIAIALHALALFVFGRLLDSPAATGSRRRGAAGAATWRVLPGVSAPVSAIATAHVRLAIRTPRGRSILLSPLVVFLMFGLLMRHNAGETELGLLALNSGLALAVFGTAVCLLAILPFSMNQFAIDGAGLTLVLLSPVRDEDYLKGKAIGNAAIAGGPALLCVTASYVLFPSGNPALWLAILPGFVSTYLLMAPAAAALSTLFPRAVDLNSIGRGSNAQGLAGIAGLLATLAAGAPAALVSLVVVRGLQRPGLLPIAQCLWCLLALGISNLLFRAVRPLFHRRRENLGLVARSS
jgi:hypothetical protein